MRAVRSPTRTRTRFVRRGYSPNSRSGVAGARAAAVGDKRFAFCFGWASRRTSRLLAGALARLLRARFDGGVSAARFHLLPGGPSAPRILAGAWLILSSIFRSRTNAETATQLRSAARKAPGHGVEDWHERACASSGRLAHWASVVGDLPRCRGRCLRGAGTRPQREIRYPDARRRGDDDDDAVPMGFGVGHPSFKAAFPESASWDK